MERFLDTYRGARFDIIVVGGGITGAAVAYEAASRPELAERELLELDVLARYLQRTVVTYPHALLITPVGIARSAPPGRTRT